MQNKEQIWADDVMAVLLTKAEMLADLILAKERSLKNAPAGRLRISMRKHQPQCFYVTETSSSHGDYIPVEKLQLAKKLAQKDYDSKILPELRRELLTVDNFIEKFRHEKVDELYTQMHPGRRSLVEFVRLPDEPFVKAWLAKTYEGKAFEDDAPEILTARGERVRSKSEAIIADTLFRLSIPYRYECPMQLYDMKTKGRRSLKLFPDFTCLNVRLRREFVWEHFGMMDNAEYSSQVAWKMACYEVNGFFPGKNLITSMESGELPLDAKKVERLAKCYLL